MFKTNKYPIIQTNEFQLPKNIWPLEQTSFSYTSKNMYPDFLTDFYFPTDKTIVAGSQLLFNMYTHIIQNIETMIEQDPDKGLLMYSTQSPVIDLFHLALFDAFSIDTNTREVVIDELRKPTFYQHVEGIVGKLVLDKHNFLSFIGQQSSKVISLDKLKEQRDEFYKHTQLT